MRWISYVRSPTFSTKPMLLTRQGLCGGRGSLEPGQQVPLREVEEAVLVGPDLVHVDVRRTRPLEPPDLLQIPLGIRAADDGLGDVVLADVRGGLLEVLGKSELLRRGALQARRGP